MYGQMLSAMNNERGVTKLEKEKQKEKVQQRD